VECVVPDELARVAALLNSTSSRGIDIVVNIIAVTAAASITAGAKDNAKYDTHNDE
jgi:hypothetical protein